MMLTWNPSGTLLIEVENAFAADKTDEQMAEIFMVDITDITRLRRRLEQDKAIKQIRDFLEMVAEFHGNRALPGYKHTSSSFLLAYSRSFYTDEKSFDGKRGTPKQCYMNAYQLAAYSEDLTYVEGYCHMGIIPIEHAWCVTKDGIVVDPTLDSASGYFGVPFNSRYLIKATLKKGTYGLLWFENREIYRLEPEVFLSSKKFANCP